MVEKVLAWFGHHSVRRPWAVMAVISLITVFFAFGIARIRQGYGLNVMLSDASEVVRTMREAEEKFGGIDEERVLVEAINALDPAVLRKVAAYRDFLAGDADGTAS